MEVRASQLERYILRLQQALAMESAMVGHLEQRARDFPLRVGRDRLIEHRDQTLRHRETLNAILHALGADATETKAALQSPVTEGVLDRLKSRLEFRSRADNRLSEDLTDFALEQYEGALYGALALMAHHLGFPRQAEQFEHIRLEEDGMAEFYAACIPESVELAFPGGESEAA